MNEILGITLQITLIGMGLVFGAIILLWGIMALLVRMAGEKETGVTATGQAPAGGTKAEQELLEMKRRAALAAVVIALAEEDQDGPSEFPLPTTPLVSAWQAVMRTNMLNKRGNVK